MNHKWENNKCVKCGIIRAEIKSVDETNEDKGVLMYQYSINNKYWVVKRPDCPGVPFETKKKDTQSFSIKEIIQTKIEKPVNNQKQDYSELLRGPKWQRKRLEIMQRDNWRCKSCDDDLSELHVHHLQYTAEKPWDEPSNNLVTLCNTCHKAIHYLNSCPDIGIETFVLVARFLDQQEQKEIAEYFNTQKNGIA